ncbi:MAG TPA: phage tail tape measure protein [Acetobacteraceae bacterium]|nr:phage tail tape measure protein [Acetobacteraceae bacterium]
MAGSGGFSVVVTATDHASAKLKEVNKHLEEMHAPVVRLHRQMQKFSELSGLKKVADGFGEIRHKAAEVARSIGNVIKPLGLLTGAASIGGMYELVNAWGEFAEKLKFSGDRIGMTAPRLNELQGAARLAGGSAEAMTSGLTSLNDQLTAAAFGRAPEMAFVMQKLGVSLRDATGHVRTADEVLPELADRIAAIKNPATQARLATMLFGGAAESLLPLLRKGSAGLRENEALMRRYGVVSEKGAEAAVELQESQTRLGLAFEGVRNSIAERLAPALAPVLNMWADWIAANRVWLSQHVGDAIMGIVHWLEALPWKTIGSDIKAVWIRIDELVDKIGGWKRATEIVFGLWVAAKIAPILAAIASIILAMKALAEMTGTTVVLAFKAADLAASTFALNPAFRSLMLLLQMYEMITHPPELPAAPGKEERPSWLPDLRGVFPWLRNLFGGGLREGANRNGGSPLSTDLTMDPTKRGFLDTIAGPESGGAYDIKNGGSRFSDFSRFPEGVGPGGASTASGRYQFTSDTWREVANTLGLPDFGKPNQDKGAWYLANKRYFDASGRDLEADLKAGRHEAEIATALGPTWPSLPFGSQSRESLAQFSDALRRNTESETQVTAPAGMPPSVVGLAGGPARPALAPPAELAPSAAAPAAAGPNGQANLTVRLDGFPSGTTTQANASGDIWGGPPRVEMAMPFLQRP